MRIDFSRIGRTRGMLAVAAIMLAVPAASFSADTGGERKPASSITAAKNAAVLDQLPLSDRTDFEAVSRGLVAPFEGRIETADGKLVWDTSIYDFLRKEAAPDTVNPSLWRHARLNAHSGLYEVTGRIYQVRGLDLANMTIIEGDDGLILIDPLTVSETAHAALELYYRHRPRKPVVAVIYSHSHADHFGGVRGVVDEAEVKAGKVKIFAPSGFLEHAISENVFAGRAMFRRAQYQGGTVLARGERGQLDVGLGNSSPPNGTITLIAPTDIISQTVETREIAGVSIEFQLTPGTEAPAEMNLYFPQVRALCIAENATKMMHNLLTPRGAEVRDARAWARYLDESLIRYGERTDVMFAQHSWPTWGAETIRTELADQRDMYQFLHDRTLHLMNQGLTPLEIAQAIQKLPGELDKKWYTRGYYGAISFNVRAVYQRYLGFYDGNPANLDPLPPVEAGQHYVEALGGADKVIALMRAALKKGDYRWAAQLGNHLVFAEPQNKTALMLQADALEQLGYQSESAPWRNMYLFGAQELRNGLPAYSGRALSDLVRAATPAMFFDLMAVRLDSDKAQGHDMTVNWVFEDLKESYALTLRNGVLTYREAYRHVQPDVSVTMSKATLDRINMQQLDFRTATSGGDIKLAGNSARFAELLGMLTNFAPMFNIVTP